MRIGRFGNIPIENNLTNLSSSYNRPEEEQRLRDTVFAMNRNDRLPVIDEANRSVFYVRNHFYGKRIVVPSLRMTISGFLLG